MKNIKLAIIFLLLSLIFYVKTSFAEDLGGKLRGRILLQVDSHGEAFYIHPTTAEGYYMANGDEAYNMMRNLGLGIKNSDLDKIEISE